MGTDVNPLDTVKTLLNDNWTSLNTDDKTPMIVKKYEHPKNYQLKTNEDLIYIYNVNTGMSASGLGFTTHSDITDTVSIDIRSRPSNNNLINDSHARKVLYETLRIIKGNILNPSLGYQIINQEITFTDTSNNSVGIWRFVIDIQLQAYHRNIN